MQYDDRGGLPAGGFPPPGGVLPAGGVPGGMEVPPEPVVPLLSGLLTHSPEEFTALLAVSHTPMDW